MEEHKILYREEQFNDVAVQELAKLRAKCLCLKQFKRCKSEYCSKCDINSRMNNCMRALSDYDLERLNNYTADYYAMYSQNPMAWMSHKNYVKCYTSVVITCIIFICSIIGLICIAGV